MIAALLLFALVAAAGQAQAMPERLNSAEMQPFHHLAGRKELTCLLKEVPEVLAMLRLVAEHQPEVFAALNDLAQRQAPCVSADDKLACVNKKLHEFLDATTDVNVKEIFNRAIAINVRVLKCTGYQAVEMQPFHHLAGRKELTCLLKEVPEVLAMLHLVAENQPEVFAALDDLAQRQAPCVSADDKLACVNKKLNEFLDTITDANVKEIFNRAIAINVRVLKCTGHN